MRPWLVFLILLLAITSLVVGFIVGNWFVIALGVVLFILGGVQHKFLYHDSNR